MNADETLRLVQMAQKSIEKAADGVVFGWSQTNDLEGGPLLKGGAHHYVDRNALGALLALLNAKETLKDVEAGLVEAKQSRPEEAKAA